jgi:hypothetical protein
MKNANLLRSTNNPYLPDSTKTIFKEKIRTNQLHKHKHHNVLKEIVIQLTETNIQHYKIPKV